MSRGAEQSYLSATCADGEIQANVSKLLFRNEAKTAGVGASTQLKGLFAIPCASTK